MGVVAQEVAEAYKAATVDRTAKPTQGRIVRMTFMKLNDQTDDPTLHPLIILRAITTNCS
ncbi:MAG TPA: hypothetical protein VG407_08735 [Caulobacteraceae bacterium]|jgi:hypothetical protein|nr:hypothetical protein [Caulobacteraceae bacterium]